MISHSKPTLSSKEENAVKAVLKSGHISKAKMVEKFENQMRQYCSVKNAVAVNSGSSALQTALLALGVKEKDEVIIPSYVCSAVLNAVLSVRAKPVIVDVNADDFNISLQAVRAKLSRKTKTIIVVHSFGLPADISPLKRLSVPIIEDCAQAIGAKYKDKRVGSWGDISVFSFYATKMITTAEGGMVASNNNKLINAIRDLTEYDQRKTYKLRYNYKMSDVQAAMGIEQLKQLPRFISQRRKIAGQYMRLLKDSPYVLPLDFKNRKHIYYRYIVRIARKGNVQNTLRKLNQRGVECKNPVFQPLHRFYKSTRCPISEDLMRSAISIPIYPSLSSSQIQFVAKKLL